tara:strand:+ start:537 stop:896 length:360 start_codon:yes stop_codon:yes gene_type:complete
MSITAVLDELESLAVERKRLNFKRRKNLERKKELEEQVQLYIRSKDTPGVKHNGKAYILESKTKAPLVRKKKEKKERIHQFLSSYGINNPDKFYEDLIDAQRQEEVEETKLKIQKDTTK